VFWLHSVPLPGSVLEAIGSSKRFFERRRTLAKRGIGAVSEQELTEAKQSYLKSWEARIAGDDFVVGELNQGLFLGRTLKYWSDLAGYSTAGSSTLTWTCRTSTTTATPKACSTATTTRSPSPNPACPF
jgi:hypothetical protein